MNDLDEKTVARFWAKVNKEGPVHPTLGTKCWLWTASTNTWGYGQFNDGTTMARSHRVSFFLVKGEIPTGLELDHLCRVRSCVNPDHLEPVTRKENLARSPLTNSWRHRTSTHCRRGHPLSGENLYIRPGGGTKDCKTCKSVAMKTYYERQRAKMAPHG